MNWKFWEKKKQVNGSKRWRYKLDGITKVEVKDE